MIRSTSTSPFSFSVRPDDTRSTIRGASPNVGASSIAPFSLTHSACTPARGEMRGGDVWVFGGDADVAPPARIVSGGHVGRLGDRQPAMPDAEVHRRIELGIGEFGQHVRPDDPDLRRPMRDEGRDVERAHADQLDPRIVGREPQRAAVLVHEARFGAHARRRQQWDRFREDASLGNGDDDRAGHVGRGFTGGAGAGATTP